MHGVAKSRIWLSDWIELICWKPRHLLRIPRIKSSCSYRGTVDIYSGGLKRLICRKTTFRKCQVSESTNSGHQAMKSKGKVGRVFLLCSGPVSSSDKLTTFFLPLQWWKLSPLPFYLWGTFSASRLTSDTKHTYTENIQLALS